MRWSDREWAHKLQVKEMHYADTVARRLAFPLFDWEYYRRTYPELARSSSDLFDEYLSSGWKQGRNPSATFDTCFYLETNPDVREIGQCPLLHYVCYGASEGRLAKQIPSNLVAEKILTLPYFDSEYYLAYFPDGGMEDPLEHYLTLGWIEGRNPSPNFDTNFYLQKYPDVRSSGICPLLHYARHGVHEGRSTARPSDPTRLMIDQAVSPQERVANWLRPLPTLASNEDICRALNETTLVAGIVLSFSHDDYAEIAGGVQNCIWDEEVELKKAGWAYLHICPAQPLPILSEVASMEAFHVSIRLNSKLIGVLSLSDLVDALLQVKPKWSNWHLVIHHLLGFSPELITLTAKRLIVESVNFWLHDYFTLCPNPPLLRNDVEFCHAPNLNSAVCSICCYGMARQSHSERIGAFFEALAPAVFAPSDAALNFWRAKCKLPHREAWVVPHGKLSSAVELSEPAVGLLRVAFLGAAVFHKGWHVFESLAKRHFDNQQYEFFHFGSTEVSHGALNVTFVEVNMRRDGRNAMTAALLEYNIDIVVNWSLCYETFSFTTIEALSAGAFVVARRDAGNVCDLIKSAGEACGLIVESEEDLLTFFASDRPQLLRGQRAIRNFTLSGVTANFLLRQA